MELQVACAATGLPDEACIRDWLEAALERGGMAPDRAREVTVRIVDEDESRALNRRFRERDAPTNVLSFPVGDDLVVPGDEALPLGDLVLCAALVEREARAQGKPAGAHWAHLLVHGALHLLGYAHESDADAAEMEALEVAVLAAGGLPDPYAGRVSG